MCGKEDQKRGTSNLSVESRLLRPSEHDRLHDSLESFTGRLKKLKGSVSGIRFMLGGFRPTC